jgi:hypothetical protein
MLMREQSTRLQALRNRHPGQHTLATLAAGPD